MIMRIRAAWVLPISGPPLENAEVVVEGDRIAEVRPAGTSSIGGDVLDFGEAVLMPGLVNAHTHLDYTVMRGLLEDIEFFPWIRELTARKDALTWEDWLASATWGAAEAVAGGVTTIGDCTDSGAALWGAKALGLGGVIYQEVFGIDERRSVPEIMEELQSRVAQLQAESAHTPLDIGISPHAPYTVRPALFRALAEYAEREALPVCIHAAESRAEAELLRSGTGPIAEMFARRGIDWPIPGNSAVAYLDSMGILGPRTLLVHGVQVSAADRHILRARDVAWAHCPKSNAKLGVGVAPLGLLGRYRRSGQQEDLSPCPRLGLGSDSVASNNTMDLFEEMRFAVLLQRGARHRMAALSAREAVEMATLGGARALGLDAQIGTLEPGKRADLCAVRLDELHSVPAYDPYSALVYAARAADVLWTMIAGQTRYAAARGPRLDDRFAHLDLAPVRAQLKAAAHKMRHWRLLTP
ncbi:MAG TPA: amidohydrolase family protein [Chthonomonadaceae bacterium]|nr:amidohydrolase family protein [Chthonomonadaceae bacterium]